MSDPLQRRYISCDLIRGLSALLVCASHLRNAMFLDYGELPTTGLFNQGFYFITGLGHQAVIVFFVLSGFFVGGSVLKRRQNFQFEQYLMARLTRLWVVLLPALLFTALMDQLLYHFYPEILQGQYSGPLNSGPASEEQYSRSFGTLLSNVFFLQTFVSPVFGSNGPLWSLAYEFWYYLLFPCVLLAYGFLQQSLLNRGFAALLVLLVMVLLGGSFVEGFLIWSVGAVVFAIVQKKISSLTVQTHQKFRSTALLLVLLVIVSLAFLGILFLIKIKALPEFVLLYSDLVVGCVFGLLLWVALACEFRRPKIKTFFLKPAVKVIVWLSDISYTLYLFHFPLMLLIFMRFYREEQLSPDSSSLLQFSGWMLVLVFVSYFFWWCFEKNTVYIRRCFSLRRRDNTNQGAR